MDSLQHLSLALNDLEGSIPAALGDLPQLRSLDLFDNVLTGEIPPEIGNLSNLTILAIGRNPLSGAIPASLGELDELTRLSLHYSGLSGPLPVEIGNLVRLEELYLNDTGLAGTLPHSLMSLSALDTFQFDHTGLCESVDDAFQAWLAGVSTVVSSGCTNTTSGSTGTIPGAFALEQAYPNPFSPVTTIRFGLSLRGHARLAVFDAAGREVARLVDEVLDATWHEVSWDAASLPAGVYFCRLTSGAITRTRPMVLLR
jgi:hypothetical protein